jgi:hypothetical protein
MRRSMNALATSTMTKANPAVPTITINFVRNVNRTTTALT